MDRPARRCRGRFALLLAVLAVAAIAVVSSAPADRSRRRRPGLGHPRCPPRSWSRPRSPPSSHSSTALRHRALAPLLEAGARRALAGGTVVGLAGAEVARALVRGGDAQAAATLLRDQRFSDGASRDSRPAGRHGHRGSRRPLTGILVDTRPAAHPGPGDDRGRRRWDHGRRPRDGLRDGERGPVAAGAIGLLADVGGRSEGPSASAALVADSSSRSGGAVTAGPPPTTSSCRSSPNGLRCGPPLRRPPPAARLERGQPRACWASTPVGRAADRGPARRLDRRPAVRRRHRRLPARRRRARGGDASVRAGRDRRHPRRGGTPEVERLAGRAALDDRGGSCRARRTIDLQRGELERSATVDPMTGVASRGAILERLRIEVAQARRYRHPLAVVLLDVDRFGEINEAYGIAGGDAVLREVALRFRLRVREADAPRALGQRRLPRHASAHRRGRRRHVRRRPPASASACVRCHRRFELKVTVSIGVATMRPNEDLDLDGLVARVNEALDSARGAGGERIALDRLHGRAPRGSARPAKRPTTPMEVTRRTLGPPQACPAYDIDAVTFCRLGERDEPVGPPVRLSTRVIQCVSRICG